jgi:hypothetical protein
MVMEKEDKVIVPKAYHNKIKKKKIFITSVLEYQHTSDCFELHICLTHNIRWEICNAYLYT